jgi:branched-chain amino acid transport system permease protein
VINLITKIKNILNLKYGGLLSVGLFATWLLYDRSFFQIFSNTDIIIQTVLGGLFVGGLYAIAASGLTLIFGVMKIIDIVQGELMIFGAYLSFFFFTLFGLDPLISLFINFPILFIVGFGIQRFISRPVLKRPTAIDDSLLIAFGLSIALQSLMIIFWRADTRGLSTFYSGMTIPIGGIVIPIVRVVVLIVSIIALTSLYLFTTRSFHGKAIRAVASDWVTASLMGIDVNRINTLTYALGTGFAGVTGALIAISFGFQPTSGSLFFLKALTVITLGGLGTVPGALVGGLLIGVSESLGSYFFGGGYRDAIAYIIFLIVLMVKPTGLLARYRAF